MQPSDSDQFQSQLPSKIAHQVGCTQMPSCPSLCDRSDCRSTYQERSRCILNVSVWVALGSNSWKNLHPIFPLKKFMSVNTEWQLIFAAPQLWKYFIFSVCFVSWNKWSTACKWPTKVSCMLCASLSTSSTVSLRMVSFPQFFSTFWALQKGPLQGSHFLRATVGMSLFFIALCLEVASWSVSLASVTNASFSFYLQIISTFRNGLTTFHTFSTTARFIMTNDI